MLLLISDYKPKGLYTSSTLLSLYWVIMNMQGAITIREGTGAVPYVHTVMIDGIALPKKVDGTGLVSLIDTAVPEEKIPISDLTGLLHFRKSVEEVIAAVGYREMLDEFGPENVPYTQREYDALVKGLFSARRYARELIGETEVHEKTAKPTPIEIK